MLNTKFATVLKKLQLRLCQFATSKSTSWDLEQEQVPSLQASFNSATLAARSFKGFWLSSSKISEAAFDVSPEVSSISIKAPRRQWDHLRLWKMITCAREWFIYHLSMTTSTVYTFRVKLGRTGGNWAGWCLGGGNGV